MEVLDFNSCVSDEVILGFMFITIACKFDLIELLNLSVQYLHKETCCNTVRDSSYPLHTHIKTVRIIYY